MKPAGITSVDFNQAPFLVIWEVTRACALACVHCRADAIARRDPRELTTDKGRRLIDQVRAITPRPLFVLTGGDPMRRPDLADLVRYAADTGLTVALTPSGTAAATRERLAALKNAGLSRIAVSLDGPTAETHDAFRRVRGSYAWTMRIIDAAIELGLPLQINSTICSMTLPHLDAMAARMKELPLTLWALFFLIQTGRGTGLEQITPDEMRARAELSLRPVADGALRDQDDRGATLSTNRSPTRRSARETRIADRCGESHEAAAGSKERQRRQRIRLRRSPRQHLPERLPAGTARQHPFKRPRRALSRR
jgi:MoaA/NifB/PqqE/SkfB family radical SAM enzyme